MPTVKFERKRPPNPICNCGLPMSRNPHPEAGDVVKLSQVGAVFECIPCTRAALARATRLRYEAERRAGERGLWGSPKKLLAESAASLLLWGLLVALGVLLWRVF